VRSLPEVVAKNTLQIRGQYKDGKREGVWRFSSRAGVELGQATYEAGVVKSGFAVELD
jgi:hypothetical protein